MNMLLLKILLEFFRDILRSSIVKYFVIADGESMFVKEIIKGPNYDPYSYFWRNKLLQSHLILIFIVNVWQSCYQNEFLLIMYESICFKQWCRMDVFTTFNQKHIIIVTKKTCYENIFIHTNGERIKSKSAFYSSSILQIISLEWNHLKIFRFVTFMQKRYVSLVKLFGNAQLSSGNVCKQMLCH